MSTWGKLIVFKILVLMGSFDMSASDPVAHSHSKQRVIVTTDGEIDDECSLVRFLLYANEWDIEGIITSSSQYHWLGHKWAGNDWANPYLAAYEQVYPNLVKHDPNFPTPNYLKERTVLGNIQAEGEMQEITPGSELIVKTLLDSSDDRPVWLQAWGGTNTIARALKTIEENHPERMEEVAKKIRFYFIWEQDETYQSYIRPVWGKYNILTIISDQFWAVAYQWNKILPEDKRAFFSADWMRKNILEGHGPLAALYKAHAPNSHGLIGDTDFNVGDFRSEGDSPAFLHIINTGLQNIEDPNFGGWGGRYINVYDNTWLDPVPVEGYQYPEGRWYTGSAWGRMYMRQTYPDNPELMYEYFKPLTRWADAIQRDFAARADWSIKSPEEANHPPIVKLKQTGNLRNAMAGDRITLDASDTNDPDGDRLTYRWWRYHEADTYQGSLTMPAQGKPVVSFQVPLDAHKGDTIHIICEVTDSGSPALTRYQRIVVNVE